MKETPRSRLLLLELICDLLIFALCAIVCVTLLVRARSMSQESTRLTQAVYLAQTAADQYLAGEDFGGDFGDFLVIYNDQPNPAYEELSAHSIVVYDDRPGHSGILYCLPISAESGVDIP